MSGRPAGIATLAVSLFTQYAQGLRQDRVDHRLPLVQPQCPGGGALTLVHRVDAGGTPACVEACAATGHNAILFGDLMDPTSEISKRLAEYPSAALRPDLDLGAGVRYSNL